MMEKNYGIKIKDPSAGKEIFKWIQKQLFPYK